MIKRIRDLVGLELHSIEVNKVGIELYLESVDSGAVENYSINHKGFDRSLSGRLAVMVGRKIIGAEVIHITEHGFEQYLYKIAADIGGDNQAWFRPTFTRSLEGGNHD